MSSFIYIKFTRRDSDFCDPYTDFKKCKDGFNWRNPNRRIKAELNANKLQRNNG